MRYRWLIALLLLATLFVGSVPVRAESVLVDPSQEPETILDSAEADKIQTLQSAAFQSIVTDISPDDTTTLIASVRQDGPQIHFVDIRDGAETPIDPAFLDLPTLSERRWRDAKTLTFLSLSLEAGPLVVTIDRDSGAIMTNTVDLPAFPLSLAPNGTRVLLAAEQGGSDNQDMRHSPFRHTLRQPMERVGLTRFDADRDALQLAENPVSLFIYDLNGGAPTELVTLPPGSGIASLAWSQDSSQLAMVRQSTPAISTRRGNLLSEKATQDALGNVPPKDDIFFQGNFVDTFDLNSGTFRPNFLRAIDGNGDIFSRVSWSTDNKTLMAQMQRPAKLVGRKYPVYLNPESAYLRFYNANGSLLNTFDRPEINAPSTAMPMFVSPDEVLINAPVGLSYRVFYYNRVSGEFRAVTQDEGTYYQVRATRLSRQLVYSYSSIQKPYEAYRTSWDGGAVVPLTNANAEVALANQVRADKMTFTLKNGAKRTGILVQPAGAAFPPRRTRVVMWQQGGPGGSVTNEWAANVEQPFNLLSNLGIAVAIVPLPGREGFGAAFYNALADGRNYGSVDIDEGVAIVDQMIQRGYTTRDRVGVTGCSYGGYFTSQSITRYPQAYAAANSQCTLLDLFAEWQFGFTPFLSYLEGRAPTADPQEYTKDSPIYNATKVKTPLLIFAGTEDFLPESVSGNFHDQVAAVGTPVKFLRFEGEGHGLGNAVSQFVAAQEQATWFRTYLKP